MNVETMTMDPEVAKVHYDRYRAAVKANKTQRLAEAERMIKEGGRTFRKGRQERSKIHREDEELAKAYKALSQGKTLINLHRVMEGAGTIGEELPALAIAKADWEWCYLHNGDSHYNHPDAMRNRVIFTNQARIYDFKKNAVNGFVSIPQSCFPEETWNREIRREKGFRALPVRALVPSIPPHLRPDDPSQFHILWEAVWEDSPPVDPLLLSKINETMYVVVAQWDLTPLEQQVLEGRF